MDLFSNNNQAFSNILPFDGSVDYYGTVMPLNEANSAYDVLKNTIEWKHDQAMMFGNLITTKRSVAWYADQPFSYTYSNITKTALEWTDELLMLKKVVESKCGERFNSCLLNLYHDQSEGMAWHSDGEMDLKKHAAIASLSLGSERKFCFKHKISGAKIDIVLPHGSLLVMKAETQENRLHRLPPTTIKKGPRINLTFRSIQKNVK